MPVYSMTGYASVQHSPLPTDGEGSASKSATARLGLEIRSVNSRFLDLSFRLPEELRQLEPALRELVGKSIKRGKVEVRVNLESATDNLLATPDTPLLKNLLNIQNQVRMWLPDAPLLSVSEVIRMASHSNPNADQDLTADVMELAKTVIAQLCEARHREGLKLADDLLSRAKQLHTLSDQALPLVPQAVALQKQKFLERWREAMALADAQALPESVHERALAEAEKLREQKLAEDEQPIEVDNDCGDACKI